MLEAAGGEVRRRMLSAVAVSDRFTNEEAYAMKKLWQAVMGAKAVLLEQQSRAASRRFIGLDASPNTIDELPVDR